MNKSMKYIEVAGQGEGYSLRMAEMPVPAPGAHEVLIQVHAAGVNRADILQAKGKYRAPEADSQILGLEVSGEIIAMGPECKMHAVGDKICALVPGGGYAEYVLAPEYTVLPLPSGCSLEQAAALPEAAFTAYHALMELGKLTPMQTVLIEGAAGGIGSMAIQLAKAIGARVVALAGSEEKCGLCRELGADIVVNYRAEGWPEQLQKQGEKIHLVLGMTGADSLDMHCKLLQAGGRIVQIGVLGGSEATFSLGRFLMKNLTLTAMTLRNMERLEKHRLARSVHTVVWPLIEEGRIRPVVDTAFSFAEAAQAHAHMAQNRTCGKLVLSWK